LTEVIVFVVAQTGGFEANDETTQRCNRAASEFARGRAEVPVARLGIG
jgi:hypothetical protein